MAKPRIGDYELGDVLGYGTVGTVYRATVIGTNRQVAVKILLPVVASDELIASRFEREMLILEKLDHPGIVHYYGGDEEGGQLYYAMEMVARGTLKDVLAAKGKLSWPLAVECARQISAALQHAHNHGVIHRDLKPANLFISEDGTLKLGDFGIARDTTKADLTDHGLTVGTYAYMSPEQIRGDHAISPKTDLYAVGCLLFQMLTGQPPYVGDNFARIFDQHLQSPPPDPREYAPDCPAPLAALIEQLMAKDPEERPFNARAVQGILEEMLTDVADREALRLPTDLRRKAKPAPVSYGPPSTSLPAGTVQQSLEISWLKLATLFAVAAVVAIAAIAFSR